MAPNEATGSTDDLRADMDQLKRDVASLVETLRKTAEDGSREGLRSLNRVADETRARAQQSYALLEQQVVEKPVASLLIAFGLGMVLGKLLERR